MNNFNSNIASKPVLFDHDGAADDYLALLALLTSDNLRLNGIAIKEGNCFLNTTVDATLKVLDIFNRNNVFLATGPILDQNPYPIQWRKKCELILELDQIKAAIANKDKISDEEIADFIAHILLCEKEKTTLILTGSASNLSLALEKYPEISEKIDKVLWQSAAFLADGDVNAPDVDGSAEWNIFCDTKAAQNLLQSGLPIILFPLDLCYQLPIDNYLIFNLTKNESSKLSQLAVGLIELLEAQNKKKYPKALLPVMYLIKPDIFKLDYISIGIEHRGTSLGNVFRSKTGCRVKYAKKVDDELFFELFTEQFGLL